MFAVLAVTALAGPAHAKSDDEKKKSKEAWKKLEKDQKGTIRKEKNPLKNILKLLKDVEDRLGDADTGEWTQDEQRQVVEALKLQKDASSALDKLIDQIQKAQNESSGSGGSSSKKQKKGGSSGKKKKNESPQQKRERQKRERERQRKQKEAQRKKEMEKKGKPEGKKPKGMKKPQKGPEKKGAQKKVGGKPPKDSKGALRAKGGAGTWGNLPMKLHQDVEKARKAELPGRFRDLIHGYRKRINED